MSDGQTDLFGDAAPPVLGPASVPDSLRRLAERLPANLHPGTSSWTFPGWRGLVYDRAADQRTLARYGLPVYARHPLLRTVGVDSSFYRPLDADAARTLAAGVPDAFPFVIKAHRLCTSAVVDGRPNPQLLDPVYAREAVVQPLLAMARARPVVLVFQFPPQAPRVLGGADFPERLRRFLRALPAGPVYAVELRNRELFGEAYLDALESGGAAHCFAVHPAMTALAEQVERTHGRRFPALVARWSLRPDLDYETARRRYQPFDRLVDEDPDTRRSLVHLCLQAAAQRLPAFVIANNKAEGSAPRTLARLAEALVD